MNELKSYTEYAVSTPTADFVIGFDFNYGEDAVNVTVDDAPATEAGYTVVYLNETTIRLSPSVPSGVVRLQRETDIDQTDHAYRAGAKFIAQTMDENFEQLRHSQQEVRDGFNKLADDTYEIIDTLQEVGQSAQDAADAAEVAAELANNAAAQVNDKVSYEDFNNKPHNAMLARDAASAHPTSSISDASGETQQQVNYNGGSKWHSRVGGYFENERVVLTNGDIVKSTIDGNTNDPNSDMTDWVMVSSNIEVNSITDLLAIPNPTDGSRVFVKSYHIGYDGGGGCFVFIVGSTKDDGGRFFKKSHGAWHRVDDGTLANIDWYGAIPESGFDSTIAIEKAGLSNPNRQVNVPAGKYEITRELSASLKCSYVGEIGSSIYELASEFILKGSAPFTLLKLGSKVQFESMCISGSEYGETPIHNLAEYWDSYGSVPLRQCRIRRFSDLGTISTTYIDFYDVFISECDDTFYISQIPNGESATVIGFHSVRFTYSKNGVQTKERPSSSMIPAIGVYFDNCGFENLDNYGVSGNLLAVKVSNSWFENVRGKYNVATSTVIQESNNAEYFTGPSIGLNKSICSNIDGIYSYLPRLEIVDYLTAPRIQSTNPVVIEKGIKFEDQYISGNGSNINLAGRSIRQPFTSDGGTCSAEVEFIRTNQGGSSEFQGSAISFKTGRLTGYDPDPMREQWRIDGYGHFLPMVATLNIGSTTNKVSKVFTATANISNLGTYTDNTAAKNGGLTTGDLYKTSSGQLMVVY